MPHRALPVTIPVAMLGALLALGAPMAMAADAPSSPPARRAVEVAQLTIRERIIIRVPRMPVVQAAPARPVVWRERRGPRCVAAQTLAGALVTARNQVDLVLIGGRRVRAKLDGDCRPLDFYSGFYVRPSADGMICADRDAIRVRSGATCEIDEFKLLQASLPGQ